MRFLASVILMVFTQFVYAQEILWAEKVITSYGGMGSSAQQVIGRPNALPQGEISAKAFQLNSEEAFGSITVEFEKTINVNYIVIGENNEPGRITEIYLFDESGERIPVLKSDAVPYFDEFRYLILNTSGTSIRSNKLELSINTAGDPGWSQIDAIGISSYDNSASIVSILADYGLLNVREEMAFLESKKALNDGINTSFDETKPIISPDGTSLYFSRSFFPGNMGGKKDAQDIFISKLEEDNWDKPKNPGEPLNNKYPNGVSSVSPDGNNLYLINNYYSQPDKTGGVAESKNSVIGWTYPDKVEIMNYRNNSDFEDFFISADGKVMLLALENETSYGDLDIYISFFEKSIGQWSEPINLGPSINSSGAEFAPFLAADGKTLYFSSNGHHGYGKSDIFFSYRTDESWLNWIKPQNLGKNVNTPQMDGYYTVSAKGDYGYFISTAGGKSGSRDIFRIRLAGSAKPDPVVIVKGKVLDSESREPLSVDISYTSRKETGSALSSPKTGDFTMILKTGRKYTLSAALEGYISQEEIIDLYDTKQYEERYTDLLLIPIKPGSVIRMNSVLFARGTANLLEESNTELEKWVDILNENPTLVIELGGHTDNRGNFDANMELSKERVEVVKEFLLNYGIEKGRLKTKGYGSTKPVNNNSTETKRAENRRVEVTIISS